MSTSLAPIDRAIPWLEDCLSPEEAGTRLSDAGAIDDGALVSAARLIRHREGRRAVIEYDLLDANGKTTLVGKVRAKGLDRRTVDNISKLVACGFAADAQDGISVPRVAGVIEPWAMWLSPKVDADSASRCLGGEDADQVARKVARAAHKLHRTQLPGLRAHSISDELSLLEKYLGLAAESRGDLESRLENVMNGCRRIACPIECESKSCIHRDFYGDQVLINGNRVFILDLDQLSTADPLLDIGNFSAHVVEQAYRERGSFAAFDKFRTALIDAFASDESARQRICIYEILSLARHIWISIRIAARNHVTEPILAEVERRLDAFA